MKIKGILLIMGLFSSNVVLADITTKKVDPKNELKTIIVNNESFSKDDFQFYARSRLAKEKIKGQISQDRAKLMLKELVGLSLMSQDAIAKGLDKKTGIQQALRIARYQVLAQAGLAYYMTEHPILDAEKEKAYQAYLSKRAKKEYHIYNIQTKTAAEANDALKQIKAGADFKTVAKAISIDPSSKKGGDLGWYIPRDKKSSFDNMVLSLKAGEMTSKAVQSKFGWHIVMIEAVRDLPVYKKEKILPEIVKILTKSRVVDYLTQLNKSAKIKMIKADGSEVTTPIK